MHSALWMDVDLQTSAFAVFADTVSEISWNLGQMGSQMQPQKDSQVWIGLKNDLHSCCSKWSLQRRAEA